MIFFEIPKKIEMLFQPLNSIGFLFQGGKVVLQK